MELDKIYLEDCMEGMKKLPDNCVDLAILDPPYNVNVETKKSGKRFHNAWDKIPNYQKWILSLLQEVSRVLKDNGVMYLWHNDMAQIARILTNIETETPFVLRSFCIWDKGVSYRAKSWTNLSDDNPTKLRSWFNVCEYCMHFFNGGANKTGLEMINSNKDCYRELKDWYKAEKERLGLTDDDIVKVYREKTGKSGAMFSHYFKDSQFAIPAKEVWTLVFEPLGFSFNFDKLKASYEGLKDSYENLRANYEGLRHTHNYDKMHSNVWHVKALQTNSRWHTCQKPLQILERLIRVSSNEGDVVLDPCMGGGSTAIAALNMGRHFIGFENNREYWERCQERLTHEESQLAMFY